MGKSKRLKVNVDDLEPKQEHFCRLYVASPKMNGKRAYMKAFGTTNENSSAVEASRLLTNPNVKRYIQVLMDERAKRLKINSDDILRELARIGYSDTRKLFKEDGAIKDPIDWPKDLARAIASIEVEELFEGHGADRTWIGYTKKVKFWPKVQALELMGKHKKLFTDRVEHSGKLTLEDLVAGSNSDSNDEKEEK